MVRGGRRRLVTWCRTIARQRADAGHAAPNNSAIAVTLTLRLVDWLPLQYGRPVGYAFEDLDDAQFERLVVECARKLFGIAVQSFATGVDGGRDARFEGTAELFPSKTEPWTGLTIIQAKHTNATNAHFSDSEFSSISKSSTLTEELVRVNKLVAKGEIDNYWLVANRRLGAVAHEKLKKRIANEIKIGSKQVYLAGAEYLDVLLNMYPDLISLARIDPMDGPLLVSSHDLAEVILAVARELNLGVRQHSQPAVYAIHSADREIPGEPRERRVSRVLR